MSQAMSGPDTLSINNTLIPDLADGDAIDLKYDTDISTVSRGKNGNSLFAENQKGFVGTMVIRLVRGSASDTFLNGLLSQQSLNFPGFVLMFGSYVKKVGDGKGNIVTDEYVLSGGVFQRPIDGKTNVEGDTNADVSVYNIKWSNAPRSIG